MSSSASHSPITDEKTYTLWSWTHLVFGGAFFIILYKYFGMSVFNTIILLLVTHTIYEWKDLHVSYNTYDNHPGKIKAARDFLASRLVKKRPFGEALKGDFHMPPNSYINSIGDSIFYIAGIALAYHFRDKISPLFVKILIGISVVYWIQVVSGYFYVTGLGLHNKDRVNEIYSNSQMRLSM
jgi:hypothetical protein